MLFEAGGDGSEVLELVEEALDQSAVATKLCLDSLPAPQPMISAKEEPQDDHHHYRL